MATEPVVGLIYDCDFSDCCLSVKFKARLDAVFKADPLDGTVTLRFNNGVTVYSHKGDGMVPAGEMEVIPDA